MQELIQINTLLRELYIKVGYWIICHATGSDSYIQWAVDSWSRTQETGSVFDCVLVGNPQPPFWRVSFCTSRKHSKKLK